MRRNHKESAQVSEAEGESTATEHCLPSLLSNIQKKTSIVFPWSVACLKLKEFPIGDE